MREEQEHRQDNVYTINTNIIEFWLDSNAFDR